MAGLALGGLVLAGSGLDVLGLTAGALVGLEVDGLGLDVLGLGLAGGVDGPRVAPGGLDGLVWGVGLGVDDAGRWVGLPHAGELAPATFTEARLAPARPAPARARLDGLGLGLAGGGLVGFRLGAGDEPLALGVALGDEPAGLGVALEGGLAGLVLLAGLAAGVAAAGVDEAQLAAGCPGFGVPCTAAAPGPADSPLPGPPAPGWPPAAPPLVPGGALPMALRSAPACDHICCPNGVTADTLIAMMSVIAATTAARRARPRRGGRDVAGGAAP